MNKIKKKLEELVFKAIDITNEAQEENFKIDRDHNELVKGSGSKLDSTGLINFLLNTEEIITQNNLKCPDLFSFMQKHDKKIYLNDIINHISTVNT